MKYALAFILFSLHSAFACEITLPHQMVIFSQDQSGKSVIQSKNCETNVTDELHTLITNLDGRVASFQLTEMMNTRGFQVQINPQSVVIQQFKTIIREQLTLPIGVQVKETHSVNRPGIVTLAAGDKLEVNCSSCLYGIQQPLNVIIQGFDGTKLTFQASADFKKMVRAYRLLAPVASFTSFTDSSLLKEEYVESIPHTELITDFESLRFYKTNKPLRTGEILRRSDLNAVNLVKAGLKTDVVLENQMIRIKTSGISRGNGTIGDLVEVYHPQKNKKYQGRVIDINKVLVEL